MPAMTYTDVRPMVAEYLKKRIAELAEVKANSYVIHGEDGPPSRLKIITAITDLAWNPLPALDLLRYYSNHFYPERQNIDLWIPIFAAEAKVRRSVRPPRGPMTTSSIVPFSNVRR